MGIVAIAVFAALFLALIAGLAWLAVSLGWVAVKGTSALNSPRAFAELAAAEGWTYTERDEHLPRSFALPIPPEYDTTAALDVLRAQIQGRAVTIFRYPARPGMGKGSMNIWEIGLPHVLPAYDPSAPGNAPEALVRLIGDSRFASAMAEAKFTHWRIDGDQLRVWKPTEKYELRKLLAATQSLVNATDGIPPKVWQEYGR
jgi:hypothetical protein